MEWGYSLSDIQFLGNRAAAVHIFVPGVMGGVGGCGVIKAHWCSCVWTGTLQFDQWLEGLSEHQNWGNGFYKIPAECSFCFLFSFWMMWCRLNYHQHEQTMKSEWVSVLCWVQAGVLQKKAMENSVMRFIAHTLLELSAMLDAIQTLVAAGSGSWSLLAVTRWNRLRRRCGMKHLLYM